MNTFLVVGGCILGYLLIGLCWARSQAVKIQQMINEWSDWLRKAPKDSRGLIPAARARIGKPWFAPIGENLQGRGFRHGLGHYAAWWPYLMVVALFSGALDWAAAPVSKRREQVGGLRARADEMAHMCEGMSDSEDKRILLACVAENRELAKELEI